MANTKWAIKGRIAASCKSAAAFRSCTWIEQMPRATFFCRLNYVEVKGNLG